MDNRHEKGTGQIVDPNKVFHFVDGLESDDFRALAISTQEAVDNIYAQRARSNSSTAIDTQPLSWTGGGEPRAEYQDVWQEQTMREMTGQPVTMVPRVEYFLPSPQPVFAN
jgi:hypothetical protein